MISPHPRKLRRGDVVNPKDRESNGGFNPGRIWRRIDDNRVQVIHTGQHVCIYHESDLVLRNDYKGRYKWQHEPGNPYNNPIRFIKMISLRRLKVLAKDYNPHFGGISGHGHRWTKEERKTALLRTTDK